MSDTTTEIVTQETDTVSPLARLAMRHGMDRKALEALLFSTVFPDGTSRLDALAFMAVADRYQLDPIRRQIYAFKGQGGRIVPIVGIDGWAELVARDPLCDGFTFVEHNDGDGRVVAITCKMHVKGRTCPTEVTEYLEECSKQTPLWRTMPRRMLRHRALIQTARVVFGFNGIYDEDEGGDIASGRLATSTERDNQAASHRKLIDEAAAAKVVEPAKPAEPAQVAPVIEGDAWTPLTVVNYERVEKKGKFARWRVVDGDGTEYHSEQPEHEAVLDMALAGRPVEAVVEARDGKPSLILKIAEAQ